MNELTGFQRDLLFVISGLSQTTLHPLKSELESYYGQSVHPGRLAPNLDVLVSRGLVKKTFTDDTPEFSVTTAGLEQLNSRQTWQNQYHQPESQTTASSP